MDQYDRNGAEICLDDLEEGVEIATFLASLASIFVVLWALVLPLMSVLGLSNSAGPYWLSLSFSLAFSLYFFLWSWSIAQMWRAPIFVGAILAASATAIYPVAQILQRKGELDWSVKLIFVITALTSISFGIRIIWDGWRLTRTSENNNRLLTTVPYDRVALTQACARAFGVHPICRWLPSRARRVIATLFFALTTAVLALALGVAIYVVVVELSTEGPAVHDICMRTGDALCAIRLISAMTGPVIGVGTCLAGAAGLRWLARRSARLSLEVVSRTDARPAIVFLRSFADDQVQLVSPKRPLYRRLLALGEPAPRLDHVLIEEATPIGPVVAIGLPGRPPPFGAARAYFNEDEWKSGVARLAAAAKAIVVVIDDTEGVLWELSHVRQAGLVSKTLYLLPPRLSGPQEAARIIRREFAETTSDHNAVTAADTTFNSGLACIGWYHAESGELKFLTTRTPTSTSYVCALRLALGPWSDHKVADLSPIERPEKPTKAGGRWMSPLVALAMLISMVAVVWLQVPSRASARAVGARAELRALATALEQYRFETGSYPTQEMGLRSLVEASPQAPGWNGPYVVDSASLIDPWGHPYIYRVPGATHDFDVLSLGRDGRAGGTGEDADITNWD